MNALVGKKNLFGSLSGSSSPDNLFSDDIVELLLGISEGPILGLVNGPASIFLNDTPLVNSNGTPELGNQQGVNVNGLGSTNFGQFDVELHLGFDPPDAIQSKLGGFGNTNNVGVLLDQNTPIVRTGTQQNIDFISFRILFSALYSVNTSTGAQSPASAQFKLEYKPHSSATWSQTYTTVNPAPGAVASNSTSTKQGYTAAGLGGQQANNYRETWIQPTQPVSQTIGAVWFNSAAAYSPKVLTAGGWVAPSGLAYATPAGSYPYYNWVENGVTIHAYISPTGATPPVGFLTTDLWVVQADPSNNGQPQSYIYNTTGWVTNIAWNLPSTSTPGIINITGQTSGGYVAEYRIPVARIADYYDVRVTKLSGENTTNFFCNMSFDSFIELVNNPLSFEGLAVLYASIRATDQFSSMPVLTLDLYGALVNVPSNYNPITRVYSGIWDGTWTKAYTNCPAYIAQDLIQNDRYGLNAYYPATVDPDSVYAFGQHCDLHGFTYNELIADARPISEAVNVILGTAGGFYAEFGDGNGVILFDDDTDAPVALFTRENVADGMFTYSRTDITARKNDFIVSYVDPNQNWIENRRRVTDTTSVAAYGLNTEEFVAAGCIDETEAYKRAKLRLAIATTECTIVDFKTNRQGVYIQPYDVILIADPLAGYGLSGRIHSKINTTTVQLRDAVTLEAGFTYQLSFQIPNGVGGWTIWESQITTGPGTTTQLVTQTALPTLPDFATFSIFSTGPEGTPKAFRITSIDEADGDADKVSISAIEINRSKWAYVDGLVTLPTTTVTGSNTGSSVAPPSNLSVTAQINTTGQQDLLIAWTPSVTALVRQTNIYVAFNGGPTNDLANVTNGQVNYLYQNVPAGKYLFALTAQNVNGFESVPVSVEFVVGGAVRLVQGPTNLAILNESVAGTFNSQSPTFTWSASQDPHLYGYTIQVLNSTTGALIRSTALLPSATMWTYTYAMNTADGAGTPSRSFTISLVSTDNKGNISQPLTLACNNPVPGPPTNVSATALNFAVTISFLPPTAPDLAGCRVYASSSNPVTINAGNLIYNGAITQVSQPLASDVTMYYAVGVYDNFDSTLSATTTVFATGQDAFVTLKQIDATINTLLTVNPPALVSTLSFDASASVDWAETQVVAQLAGIQRQKVLTLQQEAVNTTLATVAQANYNIQALQINSLTQQLNSQISANLATYYSFVTTQAGLNAASAAQLTTLTTTVTSNYTNLSGQISTLNSTVTTNNTTTVNALTTLTASVNANSGLIAANTAAITTNQGAQATINTSVASQFTTLTATVTSNYGTLSGQISTLSSTQSSGNSTQSAKTDTLTATSLVAADYGEVNDVIAAWQTGNIGRQATLSSQSALAGIVNLQVAQASSSLSIAAVQSMLTVQISGNLASFNAFTTTQATTNTALSNSITSLTATVNTNNTAITGALATTNATIATNQAAQATTDAAQSTLITNLTATVTSNNTAITGALATTNATIASNQAAQATTDGAQSTLITNLTATVTSNNTAITGALATTNATILSNQAAQATTDAAQSTLITNLTSTVTTNNTAITGALATTNATIASNLATQATTDAAQSTLITNLTTTVTGNYNTLSGQITSLSQTQTTGSQTQSSKTDTLSAASLVGSDYGEVNDVLAAWAAGNISRQATLTGQSALAGIVNLQIAQATATSSIASIQSLLTAQVGQNFTTYNTFATSQATTNTATAAQFTTLTATVTGNYNTLNSAITTTNATITSNQATQATTNTATAASLASLNTTVGSHTSSITSLGSSVATLTGSSAIKSDTVYAASSAATDAADVEAFLNAAQAHKASTAATQATAQGIAAATTQTNAFVNATAALVSVQTVLSASIDGTNASITNEALARSTADTGLSTLITNLSATVTGNYNALSGLITSTNATITSNQTAQATVNSANTSSINTLTSSIMTTNGNVAANLAAQTAINATYTSSFATQATTNSSVAASISTLNSNYGTLNSNVSNYQTTQATQNSTFAGQISTVTAVSNAGTANGAIQFSATSSSVSGVTAAYNLFCSATNNGGNMNWSGMTLEAGSGFAQMTFATQTFILKAGTTRNTVFSANSDGTLTLNAVTNVSSVLKSSGLGSNGQPYMTQNFGSSPSIIIDDGT